MSHFSLLLHENRLLLFPLFPPLQGIHPEYPEHDLLPQMYFAALLPKKPAQPQDRKNSSARKLRSDIPQTLQVLQTKITLRGQTSGSQYWSPQYFAQRSVSYAPHLLKAVRSGDLFLPYAACPVHTGSFPTDRADCQAQIRKAARILCENARHHPR